MFVIMLVGQILFFLIATLFAATLLKLLSLWLRWLFR